MRKTSAVCLALLLAVFAGVSCGKKAEAPKAGSAAPDDLLKLLPMDAKGVFFMNVNQAMSVEAVDKAITDSKDYKKFQEFVEMTQLDPRKDIYFLAAAMTGDLGKKEEKGVAVINLDYDKEKILVLIKQKMDEQEEDVALMEEEYAGMNLYMTEEKDDKVAFSFLDASNIAVGNAAEVKKVIDVYQKNADNLYKNEALTDLLAQTNKETLFWGAMIIPSEAVSKATSDNPMLSNLEGLKAATMAFDYKNRNIFAEIKLLSADAEKNQKIAKMLDGFKAMGGMMAAEKPALGELLEKIDITSSEEFVKISANIPEELIEKLKTAVPAAAQPEEPEE